MQYAGSTTRIKRGRSIMSTTSYYVKVIIMPNTGSLCIPKRISQNARSPSLISSHRETLIMIASLIKGHIQGSGSMAIFQD